MRGSFLFYNLWAISHCFMHLKTIVNMWEASLIENRGVRGYKAYTVRNRRDKMQTVWRSEERKGLTTQLPSVCESPVRWIKRDLSVTLITTETENQEKGSRKKKLIEESYLIYIIICFFRKRWIFFFSSFLPQLPLSLVLWEQPVYRLNKSEGPLEI